MVARAYCLEKEQNKDQVSVKDENLTFSIPFSYDKSIIAKCRKFLIVSARTMIICTFEGGKFKEIVYERNRFAGGP